MCVCGGGGGLDLLPFDTYMTSLRKVVWVQEEVD